MNMKTKTTIGHCLANQQKSLVLGGAPRRHPRVLERNHRFHLETGRALGLHLVVRLLMVMALAVVVVA